MKKEDDSERLRRLLDMVIKKCRCVKVVSFSYIFILFYNKLIDIMSHVC